MIQQQLKNLTGKQGGKKQKRSQEVNAFEGFVKNKFCPLQIISKYDKGSLMQWLRRDGALAATKIEMKQQRHQRWSAATEMGTLREQIWREKDKELAVVCRSAKIRRERALLWADQEKRGREFCESPSFRVDQERRERVHCELFVNEIFCAQVKRKERKNVFCAQVKERKGKCLKRTVFNLIKTVRFKFGAQFGVKFGGNSSAQ